MRICFLALVFALFGYGKIQSSDIIIFPSKNTLHITIPTQAMPQIIKQGQEIELVLNEEWIGSSIEQNLSYPFSTLSILPKHNQTLLKLSTQGTQISFSFLQDSQGLKLTFALDEFSQWWRYLLIVTLLLILIAILLYLKTKQKKHLPSNFKMTQHFLSRECKIITLENKNKIFTLFSNEKHCILLDSQIKDTNTQED